MYFLNLHEGELYCKHCNAHILYKEDEIKSTYYYYILLRKTINDKHA